MTPAQDQLAELIERIFADGVVDTPERDELHRLYREGGLTVPQVREVFRAFVDKTWGEVVADDVISDEEKRKLTNIIHELRLPTDIVPEQMRIVLGI